MATKKKRSTGRKGGAPKKSRAANKPRRPSKKVTTQKSVTYFKNPAPSGVADIAKQTAAVLGGEVVSGVVAGKIVQMLPASMSPQVRAMAGVAASGALAVLGIKKGKNKLVQMAAVGAAVQTGRSILKTFAPTVPGLGDAATLADGMDLGAIAYASSYAQAPAVLDMSYPLRLPEYTDAVPVTGRRDDLPDSLMYAGTEISGMDYQRIG